MEVDGALWESLSRGGWTITDAGCWAVVAMQVGGAPIDCGAVQYGVAEGGPRQTTGLPSGVGDGCVAGVSLQQPTAKTANHIHPSALCTLVIRDLGQTHPCAAACGKIRKRRRYDPCKTIDSH